MTGTITTYPGGTYADIDPLLGIDGWRSVADHTARNAITSQRRRQGMAVWTQSDGKLWILNAAPWAFDDTDWTLFSGGGGGGGTTLSWLLALGMPAMAAADVGMWKIAQNSGTVSRVDLVAKTGPVGADLIIDILKSSDSGATWQSLWHTNPGNRPKIAAGANLGSQTSFDVTSFAVDDVFRLDIKQVGSTMAGMNIDVQLTGG